MWIAVRSGPSIAPRVTYALATEVREESDSEASFLERDDESIDSNGPRDNRDPDLRSITCGRAGRLSSDRRAQKGR